ncbi:hypothetical protein F6X40_35510 [Paraburkholderia sp. UCT31]|uniref:hypothetical protein n=1 Tax=Paraburkholderia sp. UCT31 TaxID=2615209 RepID=UPI0016555743|nr:hypothetical protein [Paraburkholderia sp. UCT31]MBC8741858.1 hypothetical protein [Paraburkholderia sp. UCT31]
MYEKKLEELVFGIGQLHKASFRAMEDMAAKLKAAATADDPLAVVKVAADLPDLRYRVICERVYFQVLARLTNAGTSRTETAEQRITSTYQFAVDMLRREATSGGSANGEHRLDEESRMRAWAEVIDVFQQVEKTKH